MTAANHFLTAEQNNASALHAGRDMSIGTMVRYFTRMVGISLVIAAIGLWIAPNATNLPELMLMKLCASFFFALSGIHLLYSARTPKAPNA